MHANQFKLPDHRLDFIQKFKDGYVEQMTEMRERFTELDEHLIFHELDDNFNEEAARTLELARTHLETALQYSIKTICLIGEDKAK